MPPSDNRVPKEFTASRRIEFADTDMAGIVHFSRYMVFMETAEHQFLHSLGTDVMFPHNGDLIGFPRVSASCDYKRPLRYKDALEIRLTVQRIGNRSVAYRFRFLRGDEETAVGSIAAACCVCNPDEPLRSIEIPDFFRKRIQPYAEIGAEESAERPGESRSGAA